METSLHRQLKQHFASDPDSVEVRLEGYRIDAIDSEGCLVEIQHAGLGAIRDKVLSLVKSHRVRIVKPLIATKWIETEKVSSGKTASRRQSPKHATHLDLFAELLHFTTVFPHRNLLIEAPLVDVVERREPRPHRYRRKRQYRVLDQELLRIGPSVTITSSSDLLPLLQVPVGREPFTTADLAQWLQRPRWYAQQIAYVLHHCGTLRVSGKRGNAKLYELPIVPVRKRKRAA